MGTPIVDGIFRHGYTKVVEDDGFEYSDKYTVEVKNPGNIFGNLDKLNFIKCDVEGYENHIIPLMYEMIQKHKPVILIEFGSPENKRNITKKLMDFGYEVYSVSKSELNKVADPGESVSETFNFFFIPLRKNYLCATNVIPVPFSIFDLKSRFIKNNVNGRVNK